MDAGKLSFDRKDAAWWNGRPEKSAASIGLIFTFDLNSLELYHMGLVDVLGMW